MTNLSQAALDICKENYDTNCGKCPIRPSCVTNRSIRTHQDLDEHRAQINDHAERVMREREGQADIFDYL